MLEKSLTFLESVNIPISSILFESSVPMLPVSGADLLELVAKSGLLQPAVLQTWLKHSEATAATLAKAMVDAGVLTDWHIGLLIRGKFKGFFVDQYCLWKFVEFDADRGIQVYEVIDQKTGLTHIMELVHPKRARTKSDGLFYAIRNNTEKSQIPAWRTSAILQ